LKININEKFHHRNLSWFEKRDPQRKHQDNKIEKYFSSVS